MAKKLLKTDVRRQISNFFPDIKKKSAKDVKKIKRLAMRHNIPLKELRKKFCKRCLSPYKTSKTKIRIKKGIKAIECENCGYISRWKIKG